MRVVCVFLRLGSLSQKLGFPDVCVWAGTEYGLQASPYCFHGMFPERGAPLTLQLIFQRRVNPRCPDRIEPKTHLTQSKIWSLDSKVHTPSWWICLQPSS